MKTFDVLWYWCHVVRRAFVDTLDYILDQRLVSLTILFLIGLVVYFAAKSRFPGLVSEWGNPVDKVIEFVIFSLISVLIYSIGLFVINLVATPSRIHHDQTEQIKSLLPPDGLNLLFVAGIGGGVGGESGAIQYLSTTVTNRSKRNMNLHFTAYVYFTTDSGERHSLGLAGEWNATSEAVTGNEWINVQGENTFVGNLSFFVPEATKYELTKWDIDPTEDVYIMAKDTITGAEVYFKAMPGYPDGRVAELPPADKTMVSLNLKIRVVDPPKRKN